VKSVVVGGAKRRVREACELRMRNVTTGRPELKAKG